MLIRARSFATLLRRLVPGHAAASYGIYCARLAGVPAPVLERATEILGSTAAGVPRHFKGCKFHRIIPGFMVQGASATARC